jgi:hypothetical protein
MLMKPKSSGSSGSSGAGKASQRKGAARPSRKRIKMAGNLLSDGPDGALLDGTVLFGPFREPPVDHDNVVAVVVKGETWFTVHSGERIPLELQPELKRWVRTRVAYYERTKRA